MREGEDKKKSKDGSLNKLCYSLPQGIQKYFNQKEIEQTKSTILMHQVYSEIHKEDGCNSILMDVNPGT